MPMPKSKAQALAEYVDLEMRRLSLPFYGVNTFDVDPSNLAEFTARMQRVAAHYADVKGFRPHLRAMSEDGSRARLVRINYYSADMDPEDLMRLLQDPEVSVLFRQVIEILEDYEFLTAEEQ